MRPIALPGTLLWTLALVIVAAGLAGDLRADTVYLLNGSTIDGMEVGRKDGFLLLQIGNLGRIEIPEKEIKSVEKNNRTGYIDPNRGNKKKADDVGLDKRTKKPKAEDDTSSDEKELEPLDAATEKKVKAWVYDLTRQRSAHRVRAERKLLKVGERVVPFLVPISRHPHDPTRVAVYRIIKTVGGDQAVDSCLTGLEDENRFVRKLAWESLKKVSGKRYRFAWDEDGTEKQRARDLAKWTEWWRKEQKRREAEAEAEEAAEDAREDGAGVDDDADFEDPEDG